MVSSSISAPHGVLVTPLTGHQWRSQCVLHVLLCSIKCALNIPTVCFVHLCALLYTDILQLHCTVQGGARLCWLCWCPSVRRTSIVQDGCPIVWGCARQCALLCRALGPRLGRLATLTLSAAHSQGYVSLTSTFQLSILLSSMSQLTLLLHVSIDSFAPCLNAAISLV